MFVEPYVERARHVEVQILADAHGTVWALGTRDCSLQRRHQKVIEEAPAPGLPAALERELHALAVRAARAVSYVGAGTVEFLVADGRAHFLEMNTRLQVEHPVTEEVFGLDLVAEQIRIAEGRPLAGDPPRPQGHAVEARLYAEDPASGWAPQTGTLHRLAVPGGVRLDTGYGDGDTIGVHYDPMLAKVVAHAPSRAEALRKLAGALERAVVHGPVTNRELLVRSLRHEEFISARMDTGFYDRHLDGLTVPAPDPYAPLAAALADAHGRSRFGGWRNVPSQPQVKRYAMAGEEHEVRYRHTRHGFDAVDPAGVRVVRAGADLVVLEVDGVRRRYEVARHGTDVYVNGDRLTLLPRFPEAVVQHAPGSLLAPMPGTVVRVADGLVPGARVRAGEPIVWLEAMKMQHVISAPRGGSADRAAGDPRPAGHGRHASRGGAGIAGGRFPGSRTLGVRTLGVRAVGGRTVGVRSVGGRLLDVRLLGVRRAGVRLLAGRPVRVRPVRGRVTPPARPPPIRSPEDLRDHSRRTRRAPGTPQGRRVVREDP
ncbi:hypothetical protein GCM10020256_43340 [Streptomyces thermocoprophilus]